MAAQKLELEWSEDDAQWLRGVLRSVAGQRFMTALQKMTPALTGDNTEQTAMSARKREGYELCHRNHLVLQEMGAKPDEGIEIEWMDIRTDEAIK